MSLRLYGKPANCTSTAQYIEINLCDGSLFRRHKHSNIMRQIPKLLQCCGAHTRPHYFTTHVLHSRNARDYDQSSCCLWYTSFDIYCTFYSHTSEGDECQNEEKSWWQQVVVWLQYVGNRRCTNYSHITLHLHYFFSHYGRIDTARKNLLKLAETRDAVLTNVKLGCTRSFTNLFRYYMTELMLILLSDFALLNASLFALNNGLG